ncbi:MAG: hypothetical protein DMG13_12445 [Acidobacteria bacterium]|nr:MAG: hypothetical protein DMG13_12445 [Acidobacteriota bacterium]
MARESLGKSTFSVLTVTKFAIVLKSEITLPYPCSFLNIRDGRSLGLSLDLSQDKQKQCGKDTIHGFSLVLKNSGSSIAKNVYSPFRRQAETGCLHILRIDAARGLDGPACFIPASNLVYFNFY